MLTKIGSVSCGIKTGQSNSIPTVDAGNDYFIPANTPFKLIGSAEDANGDSLSFSWDEYDTGSASSSLEEMVDNGNRPLFRSWNIADTPERYFPRLQDVLVATGYTSVGEAYPETSRELTFRLTARDKKGGVATDETVITVKGAKGPFKVTQPTASSQWKKDEQVQIFWDVAGTSETPINCSEVEILLSTNAGIGFDQTLISSTPNDGEYEYTVVEGSDSSDARVMVRCLGNVFFAVNEGAFSLISNNPTANKSGGGGAVNLGYLLGLIGFVGFCRSRRSRVITKHSS
jgi:hypothetical protein